MCKNWIFATLVVALFLGFAVNAHAATPTVYRSQEAYDAFLAPYLGDVFEWVVDLSQTQATVYGDNKGIIAYVPSVAFEFPSLTDAIVSAFSFTVGVTRSGGNQPSTPFDFGYTLSYWLKGEGGEDSVFGGTLDTGTIRVSSGVRTDLFFGFDFGELEVEKVVFAVAPYPQNVNWNSGNPTINFAFVIESAGYYKSSTEDEEGGGEGGVTPEPATLLILGLGMTGFGLAARRKMLRKS